MFIRKISYLTLLVVGLTACLDKKSSPDYSQKSKEQPPTEQEQNVDTEISFTEKASQCDYYPTISSQPDWDKYFVEQADLIRGATDIVSINMEVRSGQRTSTFHVLYNKIVWLNHHRVSWVEKAEVIPSQWMYDCYYPEILKLQVSDSEAFYIVDEWQTTMFYQPKYIVHQKDNGQDVWVDTFSGSGLGNLPLYREVVDSAHQKLFLRRRYGAFELKTTEQNLMHKSVVDIRLNLTNRMNAFVGDFILRTQKDKGVETATENVFEYANVKAYLGGLEVFKAWDEELEDYVHIVQFGAEPPTFVGDYDGRLSRKASGNFDKDSSRIVLVYPPADVNEEIPFTGEFRDHSGWIHFEGVRESRRETFE